MTGTAPRVGDKVLLVDDMVDSGHTLQVVHKELSQRFPHIRDIRTAVLWYKQCSVFKPDHYVSYLADNPWIHQPFEVCDTLRPEGLKARLADVRLAREARFACATRARRGIAHPWGKRIMCGASRICRPTEPTPRLAAPCSSRPSS